jgi:3-oxoacyl-[acyl-carrier protein] reductase
MAISIDLTGKTAIVTGGTRGIGRVISRRLVEAGAHVAMLFRQDETTAWRTEEELNGINDLGHFALQADLHDIKATQSAVRMAIGRLGGGLDIVVMNAASIGGGSFMEQTPDEWQRAFDTLNGHVAVLHQCYHSFRRGGSIIGISSGAGHDPLAGMSAYGASKAALNQLVSVLAQEWGPKGVRANIVSPGSTAKETVDYENLSSSQKNAIRETALRRLGTAGDVADVVLFFASDLSSFVTGQWVRVNGGRV